MHAHIQIAHMHMCSTHHTCTHSFKKCTVNHFLIMKPFKLFIRFLRTALLTLSTMYFLFVEPQGSLRKNNVQTECCNPVIWVSRMSCQIWGQMILYSLFYLCLKAMLINDSNVMCQITHHAMEGKNLMRFGPVGHEPKCITGLSKNVRVSLDTHAYTYTNMHAELHTALQHLNCTMQLFKHSHLKFQWLPVSLSL